MFPDSTTNFSYAPPPPANTMQGLATFVRLLNEKYPIDRTIGNFQGNHSIVLDTTGLSYGTPVVIVTIWVWKQLEWRCYPVGLNDEDLALSPEGLIAEIDRVLKPQLEKLIVPSRSAPPPGQ